MNQSSFPYFPGPPFLGLHCFVPFKPKAAPSLVATPWRMSGHFSIRNLLLHQLVSCFDLGEHWAIHEPMAIVQHPPFSAPWPLVHLKVAEAIIAPFVIPSAFSCFLAIRRVASCISIPQISLTRSNH